MGEAVMKYDFGSTEKGGWNYLNIRDTACHGTHENLSI